MSRLTQYCREMAIAMKTGPDIVDITSRLRDALSASTVIDGMLWATSVGSTGSMTTIEFEPGVVADLKAAIQRLAPTDLDYAHERAWQDGNGHSHVQAALLGSTVGVAVRAGRLVLGTWQQVVVINHDNRPRKRIVEVTVMGTTGHVDAHE
ncbi:MAG: secondary thiamine-phosphate synthase enzyme YjbQ [Desulfobacterales bacterium]